jgi:subtilisin family serine protease
MHAMNDDPSTTPAGSMRASRLKRASAWSPHLAGGRLRGFLVIVCLWTCDLSRDFQAQLAPLAMPSPAGSGGTANQHVPGELFVKFRGGPLGDNATSINHLLGSEVIRSFPRVGWQLVRLRNDLDVEAAMQRYLEFEAVLAAEPNGYLRMTDNQSLIPDDPDFGEQWGATAIGAPGAWAISTGDPDIVIAVIDSGINYLHEDLSANMWRNPGESGIDDQGNDKATNGLDDDANGYVDDVFGIDPGNQDSW